MAKKSIGKIEYRVPCQIPEPENYLNNSSLAEHLELQISKQIKQLKRKGVDLTSHPQYLESVVDEQISKYLRDLETQHLARVSFIKKSFLKRTADREEFRNFLTLIEVELESTEAEFEAVKFLYKKSNPLYDEKKAASGQDEEATGDE